MPLASCLYEGRVVHRRRGPVAHRFAFPLFMFYLDLAELDAVFGGRLLWSHRRPAYGWLRRTDHFGDPRIPLDEAVRQRVEAETGRRPDGPVRLLTHLRYAGYVFNPISVFYCFAKGGDRLETVIAEVTSTPWHERHCYVLPLDLAATHGARHPAVTAKALHVSPFLDMDLVYRFALTAPGDALGLSIACERASGERVFEAALSARRREIDTTALLGAALRHPFQTLQVTAAIYWQALRLRWKGAPFHPHPGAHPSAHPSPHTHPLSHPHPHPQAGRPPGVRETAS